MTPLDGLPDNEPFQFSNIRFLSLLFGDDFDPLAHALINSEAVMLSLELPRGARARAPELSDLESPVKERKRQYAETK